MTRLPTPDLVEAIHDAMPSPGDLPRRVPGRSRDGALPRVGNRFVQDRIGDFHDLAAAHAVAIARGRCVTGGSTRTAFRALNAMPALNGVRLAGDTTGTGDAIIRAA